MRNHADSTLASRFRFATISNLPINMRTHSMTAKKIVAELKNVGSEQTRKTWMRHGAQEPCLGVKVEDMKKIQKRVKMDYQLALDLYDTGIADAMYLAGLIADDAKMTKKNLQKWVENATWGMVAEFTVPWVAS